MKQIAITSLAAEQVRGIGTHTANAIYGDRTHKQPP